MQKLSYIKEPINHCSHYAPDQCRVPKLPAIGRGLGNGVGDANSVVPHNRVLAHDGRAPGDVAVTLGTD